MDSLCPPRERLGRKRVLTSAELIAEDNPVAPVGMQPGSKAPNGSIAEMPASIKNVQNLAESVFLRPRGYPCPCRRRFRKI